MKVAEVNTVGSDQYPIEQTAKLVAAILSEPSRSERDQIMRMASAYVRQLENEKGTEASAPMNKWWMLIPKTASPSQFKTVVNGLAHMVLSSAALGADSSFDERLQQAESLASGCPITGDPIGDNAKLPTVASLTLASNLAQTPGEKALLGIIGDQYDCLDHKYYLGGDPFAGGLWDTIKQGWKKVFGSTSDKAEIAESEAAAARTKAQTAQAEANAAAIKNLISQGYTEAEAAAKVYGGVQQVETVTTPQVEDTEEDLTSANSEAGQKTILNSSISAIKNRLNTALGSVDEAKQLQQQRQEEATAAQADLARLMWAKAALEAPDGVADLLAKVTPQLGTEAQAISSMASVLDSVKTSGSTRLQNAWNSLMAKLRWQRSGDVLTAFGGDAIPDTAFPYEALIAKGITPHADELEQLLEREGMEQGEKLDEQAVDRIAAKLGGGAEL